MTTEEITGNDLATLTVVESDVLREIRHRGFAVIVWNPEELGEANPRKVEDRSVELGWEVIHDLGGPEQVIS